MKVLLVFISLCTLLLDSSAYVLTADATETSNETDIKVKLKPKSQLCFDENGKEIFGTTGFKIDCRKFVQCGYGYEFISDCQPGLLYNNLEKVCDWPRNANCVEFLAKDPTKLVVANSDVLHLE